MQELIYNQTRIPKQQWRYGLRSSAGTGCGWIAVYNALCLLGEHPSPEQLIRRFERQLPLLHGTTGTFVMAPGLTLQRMGYRVSFCADRKKFDALAKAADVCILYYYWKGKWKVGAHFTCLEYRDGRFTGYNTFSNSDGPDDYGPSLEAFVNRCHFFGCVLTTIHKKAAP